MLIQQSIKFSFLFISGDNYFADAYSNGDNSDG